MAKRPKDSPTDKGQRVMLRGRGHLGTISKIDEGGWVWVSWDKPKSGADICHVNELALQPLPTGDCHGGCPQGKRDGR